MNKVLISLALLFAVSISVLYINGDISTLFIVERSKSEFLGVETIFTMESDKEITHAFIQFIAKYGKAYASHSDASSRFDNFKANYLKMQEHNLKSGEKSSYQLGINQFSDISDEEFMNTYANLKENEPYTSDERKVLQNAHPRLERPGKAKTNDRYVDTHEPEDHFFFDYNDYDYIDSIRRCINKNWVEEGKVGIPKDQSTCGSCWAHSTIATVETLYGIVNKVDDSSMIPSFSEQQLVDCNLIPNLGCLGGRRQFAFNYTLSYGLTTSDKYPYINAQGECYYDEKVDKVFQIDQFKAYERMRNADLEKLVCQGTVSVSIRINDCLKNYRSGILYDGDGQCGCSKIPSTNHAVAIVGFGSDYENSICSEYWIAKNSWGPNWGENGFFRICKEDNDLQFGTCNIRYEPMIAFKYQ